MVFFSSNVALTLQRTDISQYIVSFLSQIAVLYLFTLIVNNSIYIYFFFYPQHATLIYFNSPG